MEEVRGTRGAGRAGDAVRAEVEEVGPFLEDWGAEGGVVGSCELFLFGLLTSVS